MKRIIYTRPGGMTSVVTPAPGIDISIVLGKDMPSDATDIVVVDDSVLPNRDFRNAWRNSGGVVSVDMPHAREIHADRIAHTQAAEIARLKIEERREHLKGNTTQADKHAADLVALEALDLNVLATQIAAAPNPVALNAIWPAFVSRQA